MKSQFGRMHLPPLPSTRAALTALVLSGSTAVSSASGMRLVSQDAFAAGRGEAFVATADNLSAIYYNPAGLTQVTAGSEYRTGVYGLYFSPSFQPPAGAPNAGTTYEIDMRYAAAPQFFYAYGLENQPVTLGLGIYSPHGAAVEWPQDTGFRAVATEGRLTYLRANPVLAWQATSCLSFAIGVMIDFADISLEQGLLRTASPFPNNFAFKGDDLSVGYNLGVLWEVNEKLSLGATVRSGTTLDFEGHTEIEQQPVISYTELPAHAEYDFPFTAVVGLSYRPTPDWDIGIDVDYTAWSSFDEVTIAQSGTPPFPVQSNIPVTLAWKDSWIYKFGVTRKFDDGWRASLGYVFSENSVPDAFYSPLVADLDRHFLSVGVGRDCGDYSLDVTYQFGFASDHVVAGSTPSSTPGRFVGQNGDGTYDFTSHALVVSFGGKF